MLTPSIPNSADLKLWYTAPAARWTESLLMGNGRIGACVWGGIEREVINLNEDSLWTGEPRYEIDSNALTDLKHQLLGSPVFGRDIRQCSYP
jgi:alpha-L-fucosidase 2